MSQHQHQHQHEEREPVVVFLDRTVRNIFNLEDGHYIAGRARSMQQALEFLQKEIDINESHIVTQYLIQPKALSVLDYVIVELEDNEDNLIDYSNEMLNPNNPNLELHLAYNKGNMTDEHYKSWNRWYHRNFASFLLPDLHYDYMYIIRLKEKIRFIHDNYITILNINESTFVSIMKDIEKLLNE